MEKLEKEKARSHVLEASKTKEEAESAVLQHKVEELNELVKSLEEKNEKLEWENGKLKEAKETISVDLEKSERKMRELQEVQVDLMSQIGEKNQDLNQLSVQVEELSQKLESETVTFKKEREQILLELAVAQQTITDLLGISKENVVVGVPANAPNPGVGVVNNDTPPTLPVPREDMVDKTAYEALQLAYENVSDFHYKEAEDNKRLKERLQESKRKIEELEGKKKEYRYRIEKCHQEYEAKVREVVELQKSGNVTMNVEVHDELTALRAKVRDMEENQVQMSKSFDEAIAELSQRKEELKQKAITVAEMDEKIATLEDELVFLRQEYEDIQDKHDHVLQEKTTKMDQQQCYLDEKVLELTEQRSVSSGLQKEKAKLDSTVKQLRAQLDTLKASVRSTEEKSCPVCNTKFPRRISQQDFERHVQAHFTAPQ